MGQPMVTSSSTNDPSTRFIDSNRPESSPTESSPTDTSVDVHMNTSCLACGGAGFHNEGGGGGDISTICTLCKGCGVISRTLAASVLSRSSPSRSDLGPI